MSSRKQLVLSRNADPKTLNAEQRRYIREDLGFINKTSSEWVSENPVLGEGEQGYDKDRKAFKIGDGVTAWNDLPYIVNGETQTAYDATERLALGTPAGTYVEQNDVPNVIFFQTGADASDANSWIALPASKEADGSFVVEMELADVKDTVPGENILGEADGLLALGDGVTTNGKKFAAMKNAMPPYTTFVLAADGTTTAKHIEGNLLDTDTPAGLSYVGIGSGVTALGATAFSNNSLTSVTIPDSVTTIENHAFFGNSLTSVTIPDSVTTIGNSAFSGNSSLASINIPPLVTAVPDNFAPNCALPSIVIPDQVTSVGTYAFNNNPLTDVTIGSGVTFIDAVAFGNNASLSVVKCYIEKTVIDGSFAFYGCSGFTVRARSTDGTWTEGTGLSIGSGTNVTVIKDL